MSVTPSIRMRMHLDRLTPPPEPLACVTLTALWQNDPVAVHRLLELGYADGGGSVGCFEDWFFPMVEDDEFDPALVLIATANRTPIGLAQCWSSGFLKDLVVHPDWRNHQVGSWLLYRVCAIFAARGQPSLDLKVETGNTAARRFYARHGMIEVA